jgi:cytochrome bd-type quinol oxidase subunit 1
MPQRESITYQERYVGAQITSIVFKVFSALCVVAGIVVSFRTDITYNNSVNNSGLSLIVVLAIEVGATALGAATFAFFAYVIDLLRGIWEETAGEND